MMPRNKSLVFFLIVILSLIWGSSFILIKRGVEAFTPLQVGSIRILISFLCLLPFIINKFRQIERSRWKYLAATGFLGNGIPAVLFPLAETHISSAVAGMANALTPVFTLIAGMLLFKMPGGRNRILGVIIGLLGAVILIFVRSEGTSTVVLPSYIWYIIAATICYAFSVNIIRNYLYDIDSVSITGFALMFTGVPMGIILFFTDFTVRFQGSPGALHAFGFVALLGILSTALSTVLFNKLIKISGALSASSVTYLIPVVSACWGIWDGEILAMAHVAGLAVILSGVYLINRK